MTSLKDNPQLDIVINAVIATYPEEYQRALKHDSAVQVLTNLCVQNSGRRTSPLTFSLALQRRIEKDRKENDNNDN